MSGQHAAIAVGAACTALSLELCYIPHRLLDGGTTGLAVVAARLCNLPPVSLLFALNAFFALMGFHVLGRRFVTRAMVGFLSFGLTLYLVGPLPRLLPHLASALLGGLGTGLGTAVVLRCGGALDGCEVIGQVLRATLHIPLAWSLLGMNALLFTAVIALYGLEPALSSVVAQGVAQATLFLLLPRKRASAGP